VIKSILLPISGAFLAIIILFASIYIYQTNVTTLPSEEPTKDLIGETPLYQETVYKQTLPERERTIYDVPTLLIYIMINSDEEIVSLKIDKIIISNNGVEKDITMRSLFQNGFLKTDQKVLVSAVPVFPGIVEYVKIELVYSTNNLPENRRVTAEYLEQIEIDFGETYEIVVSVNI